MRSVVGARAANSLAPVLVQVHARHPSGEPFRVADMPFTRAIQERGPVRGVMMVVERPGGGEAWLEMSATPIWDEAGELAGVIQTLTDRTEAALKSRELMSVQTREGLRVAGESGRRPGRPTVMTEERLAVARELRLQGRSFAHVGLVLGVSANAVQRALRARDPVDERSGV